MYISYTSFINCNKYSTVCYTSCKSFAGKLAILILFKKLSPVFSCWVASLIYLLMYTCINTLNSFSCICNFNLVSTYLTKPLPHVQIHPNLVKYTFLFIMLTILPIMLVLCSMLLPSYYAQNYGGILGSSLILILEKKTMSSSATQ